MEDNTYGQIQKKEKERNCFRTGPLLHSRNSKNQGTEISTERLCNSCHSKTFMTSKSLYDPSLIPYYHLFNKNKRFITSKITQ